MELNQYQLPPSPESPETPRGSFGQSLEQAEAVGQYSGVKAYEARIEELRRQADATIIPRYLLSRFFEPVTSRLVSRTSPEGLERKLVDAESEIGGQQLRPIPGIISQRFWYHKDHWYYEATDQSGPMHASYKIEEDAVFKIQNGRLAHLVDTERQSLLQNIPEYYRNIATKLYGRNPDEPELEVSGRPDDYDLAA